jgi:hypothetical protein
VNIKYRIQTTFKALHWIDRGQNVKEKKVISKKGVSEKARGDL